MTQLFLKAKHWQLFITMFGIPVLIYIVIMQNMLVSIMQKQEPDLDLMLDFLPYFPILIILGFGSFMAWIYTIGVGLQERIPEEFRLKTKWFKFFIAFATTYILGISIGVYALLNNLEFLASASYSLGIIGIIFPAHLFSMFCVFYGMYFAAKTIKTAELQEKPSKESYIGEFFLIWFYPIGVWLLQPKINKINTTDKSIYL